MIEKLKAAYAKTPKNWHIYDYPKNTGAQSIGSWQLRGDIPLSTGELFPSGILAISSSCGRDAGAVYLGKEDRLNIAQFIALSHSAMPLLLETVKEMQDALADLKYLKPERFDNSVHEALWNEGIARKEELLAKLEARS
jgi:hypothetical protein